ncbi:MAG: dethiobiotin synthase [Rhizobacter sp.]|nr:dethiobiotin synthase [Chlorobiales bacterium]
MTQGVFIVATDRDIGKTLIATGIGKMLKNRGVGVAMMKPISVGSRYSMDAKFFTRELELSDPLEDISPYCFENMVVPSLASEYEHKDIDDRKILAVVRGFQAQKRFVICESQGGVMTPYRKGFYNKDLVKLLGLPVIVVTRAAYGTVNHTLLTLRVLKAEGIHVDGIVINEFGKFGNGLAETTNPQVISDFSEGVPVLAVVDWKSHYQENFSSLIPDLEKQLKLARYCDTVASKFKSQVSMA